jgi:DNA-directed RNA polymerase
MMRLEIMLTHDQIEEQIQLERDQIRQGLKRLRDNSIKLENQSYASATIYGIASIDTLLPLLVDRIVETNERIHSRHNGVAFRHIHQYLANLEPLAAAAIACKLTIDKVFSFKDGSNQATNVVESIGQAIEDECRMRHYEKEAPGLLNTLKKNYWHKSCGTQQKLVVIRTLMNRYNVKKWEPWSTSVRVKLGAWLLDCIMESSGWFEKQPIRQGRKTVTYVLPTAEFLDIKDKVMADAELFSPLTWPMLIPPNDWSNEKRGGYMLNEVMHGHDLVRRSNPFPIQGEKTIEFLNKIQKVGYRLSPFIVSVSEHFQEKGVSIGKFLPIINYDLPPKPPDIEENYESRKSYRRERAKVENLQKNEFRRSCRTRMTMQAVEKFKDKERFYIPWNFDYRGRAYPIPAFLTPQDTDWGKSLIRFADESYLSGDAEEWLAFQVATTYGNSKDTWKERQEWVSDNIPLITKVATDPIGGLPDWEGVEEPWQFLAACWEYYHCCIIKDKDTTGLPVATDATCSGLQILALLAKDKKTAQLVNVLPSDRPQDAYTVVSDAAKPNCPSHIQAVMDRKTVKRTVMTLPYNAKPYSNRAYIKDALKEKGIEIDKDDLTIVVQAVRGAMHTVVPGPMAVMKWIEDEVSKVIKRGAAELEWVTPSGFVVNQKIMKKKVETIELKLLGRCQLRVATDDTNQVDKNRHKAATAPNLIHSLDATLLHLSVEEFNNPIALIHDSVLCRATDMSELSRIVRKKYLEIAEHDYLTDFAAQLGAESDPPIIGDLKPESVIESTYFFC